MLGKLDRHTIGQRDDSSPRHGADRVRILPIEPQRRRRHDTGGSGFSPDILRP